MNGNGGLRSTAHGLLLLVLCGCSTFVAPKSGKRSAYDREELIPYRTLDRGDFKATEARGRTPWEQEHVAAQTCARIVVRPNEPVTEAVVEGTKRTFVSHLDDPIFFAVFDRNCSSWRPENGRELDDVLEHEQTHFAFAEVAARRLNAERDAIVVRVRKVGSTEQEAYGRANAELVAVLDEAMDAFLAKNTRFDKEVFTAGREPQRRWYLQALSELDATRALARGPQLAVARAAASSQSATPAPAPPASFVGPSPAPPPLAAPASSAKGVPAPPVPTGSFPLE